MDTTTPLQMFFKGLRRFVPELTFAEVRRDEEIEGGESVVARGATPLPTPLPGTRNPRTLLPVRLRAVI